MTKVLRSRVSKDYAQLANLPASILLKIDMSIPYIMDLETSITNIRSIPDEDRWKWSLEKPLKDALDMIVDFERSKANGNVKTADGYLSSQNMVYGMQTPEERFGIKAAAIVRYPRRSRGACIVSRPRRLKGSRQRRQKSYS